MAASDLIKSVKKMQRIYGDNEMIVKEQNALIQHQRKILYISVKGICKKKKIRGIQMTKIWNFTKQDTEQQKVPEYLSKISSGTNTSD